MGEIIHLTIDDAQMLNNVRRCINIYSRRKDSNRFAQALERNKYLYYSTIDNLKKVA